MDFTNCQSPFAFTSSPNTTSPTVIVPCISANMPLIRSRTTSAVLRPFSIDTSNNLAASISIPNNFLKISCPAELPCNTCIASIYLSAASMKLPADNASFKSRITLISAVAIPAEKAADSYAPQSVSVNGFIIKDINSLAIASPPETDCKEPYTLTYDVIKSLYC